jgi:Holliday junction DNA helicase RuvA
MIAMISGTVVHRDVRSVVIDVQGVGYVVQLADVSAAPPVGQEVMLHTSMQVREDSMTLYGFSDRAALTLFELLLTSSGVGPKLAQAALATLAPGRLRGAIASADLATLTTISGVGRKVAQRMVLELKDKVGGDEGDLDLGEGIAPSQGGARATVNEALLGLGYAPGEIRIALADVDGDDEAVLLRSALRKLAGALT